MNDDIRASSNRADIRASTEHDFWVFNIKLQLNLGYRLLRLNSRTNLESVPQFAEICRKYLQNRLIKIFTIDPNLAMLAEWAKALLQIQVEAQQRSQV